MYHAYGQAYFAIIAHKRESPVYILPKFDFVKMLECVQKFKITSFTLVPPIAVALAKSPIVKNYDLSSIENVGCGAAPLSAAVSQELERLWPEGKINVKVSRLQHPSIFTRSQCSFNETTNTPTARMGYDRNHVLSHGLGSKPPLRLVRRRRTKRQLRSQSHV